MYSAWNETPHDGTIFTCNGQGQHLNHKSHHSKDDLKSSALFTTTHNHRQETCWSDCWATFPTLCST